MGFFGLCLWGDDSLTAAAAAAAPNVGSDVPLNLIVLTGLQRLFLCLVRLLFGVNVVPH